MLNCRNDQGKWLNMTLCHVVFLHTMQKKQTKQEYKHNMSTLLHSLKVLDFSTLLPGPFASLYLADLGAEVVHVESPTRIDLMRTLEPFANGQATAHSYLNRNKQSISLDLKDPANIALIKQKISQYDIVIEQFRPGVMQRLGLDYATLAAINPRLIYCSITGYGQTGSYKDKAGHDLNYVALAGIMGHSGRQNSAPPALGIQMADVAGGSFHAVMGILAAVIERHSSGLGQYIDISMTDCVASLNTMAAAAVLAGNTKVSPETGALNGGSFYDYYQTQDGRYMALGGIEPQFVRGLAEILQLPELVEGNKSFAEMDAKVVKPLIQAKIASKSLAEWQAIFSQHDVCAEAVLALDEALHSELARERGWVVNVPLTQGSTHTEPQLGCPIQFSRSQKRYDFVGQALDAGTWTEQTTLSNSA